MRMWFLSMYIYIDLYHCITVYFVLNLFFYYSFRIDDGDDVWIKVFYNNRTERKFSKNEMV